MFTTSYTRCPHCSRWECRECRRCHLCEQLDQTRLADVARKRSEWLLSSRDAELTAWRALYDAAFPRPEVSAAR